METRLPEFTKLVRIQLYILSLLIHICTGSFRGLCFTGNLGEMTAHTQRNVSAKVFNFTDRW